MWVNAATSPRGKGKGREGKEGRGEGGRRRKFQRKMVPKHGKYLVSTQVFRVCTHVVMFRNVYVCFRRDGTECVCARALVTHWEMEGERCFPGSGSDVCKTDRSHTSVCTHL